MNRRDALTLFATIFTAACGAEKSITSPSALLPRATLLPATGHYTFEFVANEPISVLDAMTAVGLPLQIKTDTKTPGPLIQAIAGIKGDWRIDHRGAFFSANVGNEMMSRGDHVGCYLT